MTRIAVVAGAVLGVLSRIEETTDGFSAQISTNTTWLGVAFAVGVAARPRASPARAALAGALALTAANAAYYAWIAATEPGTALAGVAGPPVVGLALGAALPVLSGARPRERALGAGLAAAVLALALTGRLEALMP
jgi:hypothetical protein